MRKCSSTPGEFAGQRTEFHAQNKKVIFRCRIKPDSVRRHSIASDIDGVSSRREFWLALLPPLRYRSVKRPSSVHIYDHSSHSSQCHLVLRFQGITRGYVQKVIRGSPYLRLPLLFLNGRVTIAGAHHARRLMSRCIDHCVYRDAGCSRHHKIEMKIR